MFINIKFKKFIFSFLMKKRFFLKCNFKKNVVIVCFRFFEEKGSGGNEIFFFVFCRKGEKKGIVFIDDYISI